MSKEEIVRKLVEFYITNPKKREQYKKDIIKTLNDMKAEGDSEGTQVDIHEVYELLDKTGTVLLSDRQISISNVLSLCSVIFSFVAIAISISSAVAKVESVYLGLLSYCTC